VDSDGRPHEFSGGLRTALDAMETNSSVFWMLRCRTYSKKERNRKEHVSCGRQLAIRQVSHSAIMELHSAALAALSR
jgi:hypothetical protein